MFAQPRRLVTWQGLCGSRGAPRTPHGTRLGRAERQATHFFRDGSDSFAQSLRVQVRDASGAWADASAETVVPTGTTDAPVVHVAFTATKTDAVRVVLTAKPDMHITISEIEVLALVPGTSSDSRVSGLTVDGTALAGFDPEVTRYTISGAGPSPVVGVETVDPYASVQIVQASPTKRTATETVTSEDGTQSRTYTVAFPAR